MLGSRLTLIVALSISAVAAPARDPQVIQLRRAAQRTASEATADNSDCEKARELCVKSCSKFRESCDKNHQDDPQYCVALQNQCEASCKEAWRKCNER
jgi:hypothetical protein